MRLRQETKSEEESDDGHEREEPLNGMRTAKYVEKRPVTLHCKEHENIREREADGMAEASDFGGEELGRHRPRDHQQSHHAGADVQQKTHDGHPAQIHRALSHPDGDSAGDEHASGHQQRRQHQQEATFKSFKQPRVEARHDEADDAEEDGCDERVDAFGSDILKVTTR